jgi:hypothetical protein
VCMVSVSKISSHASAAGCLFQMFHLFVR